MSEKIAALYCHTNNSAYFVVCALKHADSTGVNIFPAAALAVRDFSIIDSINIFIVFTYFGLTDILVS